MTQYDLVIIGSGPGGRAAAIQAGLDAFNRMPIPEELKVITGQPS